MNKKTIGLMMVFFYFFCFQAFGQSGSSQYLFQENFRGIDTSNNVTNIGFTDAKRVIYDGTITLLDYVLSDSALAVLNIEELEFLRIIIYAKQGLRLTRRFTQFLNGLYIYDHITSFSWYNPRTNNIDDTRVIDARLTGIDRLNLRNIQIFQDALENKWENRARNIIKRDLVGFWGTPTDAWAGNEIAIYNDDTIFANVERFSDFDRDIGYYLTIKGKYRIENGFLVVFVTEQYVGTPDYIINRRWRWPNGVTFNNGTVFYNEPIRLIFPVGNFEDVFGLNGRRIGASLYAFSMDSFYFWRKDY